MVRPSRREWFRSSLCWAVSILGSAGASLCFACQDNRKLSTLSNILKRSSKPRRRAKGAPDIDPGFTPAYQAAAYRIDQLSQSHGMNGSAEINRFTG